MTTDPAAKIPRPAPMVYIKVEHGSVEVSTSSRRNREGGAHRELIVTFPSGEVVGTVNDLLAAGYEHVQSGGVRFATLVQGQLDKARWMEHPLESLADLLGSASGPLRMHDLQQEMRRAGLIGDSDADWKKLVDDIRSAQEMQLLEIDDKEHVWRSPEDEIAAAETVNAPPDGNPLEQWLRAGKLSDLKHAKRWIADRADSDNDGALLVIKAVALPSLSDSEQSINAPQRIARLTEDLDQLWPCLFDQIATPAAERILTEADTGRREQAASILELMELWSRGAAGGVTLNRNRSAVESLLKMRTSPTAWKRSGSRIELLKRLTEDPSWSLFLQEPAVWSGLNWTTAVRILREPPLAIVLDTKELMDGVLRPVYENHRKNKSIEPVVRLSDITTAPAPLSQLVRGSDIQDLLFIAERRSAALADALQSIRNAAISDAAPTISENATSALTEKLSAESAELSETRSRLEEVTTRAEQLRVQLDATEHELRSALDAPRRAAAEAGSRLEASARMTQVESFRLIAELLAELSPISEVDDSVRTLRAAFEARAARLGLESIGSIGDTTAFDSKYHDGKFLDGVSVTVIRVGYSLDIDGRVVLQKALVKRD